VPRTNSFISAQSASTSSFLAIAILHQRCSRFFAHLRSVLAVLTILLFGTLSAHAQGFGTLRGTVKDPTGAVLPQSTVTLKSTWTREQTTQTDSEGAFTISAIPFGEYTLEVESPGFAVLSQPIQMIAGSAPYVELTLSVVSTVNSVDVTATTAPLEATAPSAASAPILVSSHDIMQALPGADRMASLQFITETTPGAFVLHDHLHVRGGHQINWLINGCRFRILICRATSAAPSIPRT
jgi:hypothetical protein